MSVSSVTIRFMLACYMSPEPSELIGVGTWESHAGKEVRKWLKNKELVDENYQSTERGRAWVDMITATPLPDKGWIDPRTGKHHAVRQPAGTASWSKLQDPNTWEAGK